MLGFGLYILLSPDYGDGYLLIIDSQYDSRA